jgi:ParB family chromosome partitioning protein
MTTKTIQIEDVKVGERFRKDLGDVQALAKSIEELGLLQPIVVNEATNELIAGHRRLEACKLLGWKEIPANAVNLENMVRGEYAENAFRKEFTVTEMVAIKRAIEPIEREQAKERQLAGKPVEESAKGQTRDRIASSLGVSHDTLSKAEIIVEAAEHEPERYKELVERVDKKEVSINKAYNEIKPRKSKDAKDVVFLPEGLYSDMISAIDEAAKEGKKQLKIVHNGHTVLMFGEERVEISAS